MTTVAWDGKTLAADRQMTYQDTKYECDKLITIIKDEMYCAFSGDLTQAQVVIKYLVERYRLGIEPDMPEVDFDKVDVVIVRYRPRLMATALGEDFEECDLPPRFAVGSGSQAAMAVLNLGFCARLAVRSASQVDVYTGIAIDVLEDKGIKRYSLGGCDEDRSDET